VVSGLDNPRQLSVGTNGRLYVAEAGHGAATPAGCVGEGQQRFCVGNTGRISRIELGATPKRVTMIGGLPSASGPDGSFAGGANGVAQTSGDRFVVAAGEVPELTPDSLEGRGSAALIGTGGGGFRTFADLLAHELEANPDRQLQFDADGNPVDALTNPYAVLRHRGEVLVADAGANAVLAVSAQGRVRTFAVPPVITAGACAETPNNTVPAGNSCDTVPTGLAHGPDGYVYLSGLGGEAPGTGRVWKLHPVTGKVVRTWGGFTTAHGVGVGPDGSVWVSELFPGKVTKVAPNGRRTSIPVPFPGGIAVAPHGVYVSAFSIAPAAGVDLGGGKVSGQVWKIG
jgi:hypothetical protein